jgi:N-acetylmuramoyl-L-alanine amidase
MHLLTTLLAALLSLAPALAAKLGGGAAEGGSVTIALGAPSRLAARRDDPPILGARDRTRPLVVIDAGHGGRDPGAISPHGGREKDVTLALARSIRDELVASGRLRVALTRDADAFIDLRERYEIARRLGADLFVSVHADAAPNNDGARGATIYTLSEVASDREAALLAARENRTGLIRDADLSRDPGVNRILIDLAQRESMDESAQFARLLRREASSFFPFRPEYHRFASLIVLKAPDIPSILFESGYLTNATDAAYIQSPQGRRQIATGMRRAIEAHFARRTTQVAGR